MVDYVLIYHDSFQESIATVKLRVDCQVICDVIAGAWG